MQNQNFIRDENSKYNEGILLDDYNGVLSIVAAQEAEDGTIYKRWVHPSMKDKKPSEKAIPCKITLGEPRVALEKLKLLVAMVESDLGYPPSGGNDGEDQDLPF